MINSKLKKSNIDGIRWMIFTDGAARGNPGPSGAGVFVVDSKRNVVMENCFFLGKKTNNQAEYLALVFASMLVKEEIEKQEIDNIELMFFSDSELLVHQMNNFYKVKNPILAKMKREIDSTIVNFQRTFKHIPREKNKNADYLANYGIDKKAQLPKRFLEIVYQIEK
jgi:ribonuclease HI